MRILPMGDRAVLVEALPSAPAAWADGLRSLAPDGLVDVVPAARTVLVRCASTASLLRAVERFGEIAPADGEIAGGEAIVIPVRYDGPDLAAVAAATGRAVADVVALHAGATYRVAFCGFAPGFAYLEGLPGELHIARRSTPRVRVPAGSVAIAAEYAAVYPRESPGGWHLIGTTSMTMWDLDREPPAPLTPGTIVRFEAI